MRTAPSPPVGLLPPGGSHGRPEGPPPCIHHPLSREAEVAAEAEAGAAGQPTSATTATLHQMQPRTSMQPTVLLQPADRQAAAIQAISDQLGCSRMPGSSSRPQPPGTGRQTTRRCSGGPPKLGLQAPAARTHLNRAPAARSHLNRAPAARSHLRPTRGYRTHQLALGFRPDSFPHTLLKAIVHQLSPRLPAPQVTQLCQNPNPPGLQGPQTYCQMERRHSRISALLSLQFPPTLLGRNSSDELEWTPSCFNRWRIQLQPWDEGPAPQSRQISSSEEWD